MIEKNKSKLLLYRTHTKDQPASPNISSCVAQLLLTQAPSVINARTRGKGSIKNIQCFDHFQCILFRGYKIKIQPLWRQRNCRCWRTQDLEKTQTLEKDPYPSQRRHGVKEVFLFQRSSTLFLTGETRVHTSTLEAHVSPVQFPA